MMSNKGRDSGLSKRRRRGESADSVDPSDELNEQLVREVRFQRGMTEIKANQQMQFVLDERIQALKEARKKRLEEASKPTQPEPTILSGSTFEEQRQTIEELPGNMLNAYLLIATSWDRLKTLKPAEVRRELRALVKMIGIRDPKEIDDVFFKGFKLGGEMQARIITSLRVAMTPKERNSVVADAFDQILKQVVSVKKESIPLFLFVNPVETSVAAGTAFEFDVSVFGGKAPVLLELKGDPPEMKRKWTNNLVTFPTHGLQGPVKCTLSPSTKPGRYGITITAKDSEGGSAFTTFNLLVT